MTVHQDPHRRSAALAILRASHLLGAGLLANAPRAPGIPAALWLALALWPYVLSYRVAAATLSRGRVGAVVQSTLCLLFTMPAIDVYRGQLLGTATTIGVVTTASVVLAVVLLVASGHGRSAQRCVDGAGLLERDARRLLAVQAVCGGIAAASLGLRADLWQGRAASWQLAPQWAAALITAALPYAASALYSLNTVVSSKRRERVRRGLLIGGTVLSVGYYGGLFGWPLQYWRDWAVLFALSVTFILAADWTQGEGPRYG